MYVFHLLQHEKFVVLLKNKEVPYTRHVTGSNYCLMNVFPDRIPGRAIIVSVVSFAACFYRLHVIFWLDLVLLTKVKLPITFCRLIILLRELLVKPCRILT